MDRLQQVINQLAPQNEFHDFVMGTAYEKKMSPFTTLLEGLATESRRGPDMDVDGLSKRFADGVKLQVWRYAGTNLVKANQYQREAIEAQLDQLRHAVTRQDMGL